MQIEFEAKFIKIDKDDIRAQLKKLGAVLVFAEKKYRRVTLETGVKSKWIRIRDEGDKVTVTLKHIKDPKSITGTEEILMEVDDFDNAIKLFENLGYEIGSYQENLREKWQLGDITFDIDTWPQIDPWLEIESTSENKVKEAAKLLGFDMKNAYFGSADIVYREVYGIEILDMEKLTF